MSTSTSSRSAENAGGCGKVATARRSVSAFARYCTVMPRGIQRCVAGVVASASTPIAYSARLQDAMACTVPRWLCTSHQLRSDTSARPGSRVRIIGAAVRKYGARSHTAALTRRRPGHEPENRRHVPSTLGVLTAAGYRAVQGLGDHADTDDHPLRGDVPG